LTDEINEIIENWRKLTLSKIRFVDDEWLVPSCAELARAAVNGSEQEQKKHLAALAAARSRYRWSLEEGLEDLKSLVEVLEPGDSTLLGSFQAADIYVSEWLELASATFELNPIDPLTGQPDFSYLELRMREHFERQERQTVISEDKWGVLTVHLVQQENVEDQLLNLMAVANIFEQAFKGWPCAQQDCVFVAVAPRKVLEQQLHWFQSLGHIRVELSGLPATYREFKLDLELLTGPQLSPS